MGPKSFEQAAGFLKIPESDEELDNTWVHPENYPVAREIRRELRGELRGELRDELRGELHGGQGSVTLTQNLSTGILDRIKQQYKIGNTTVNDIIEELKKPNRDPRDGYPKPVMQKGVTTCEDLHEGMTVTGKIKNVVDFGAFVDLGIKETALVHISELSDQFVKDPMNVVKVGDVLEFRIIGLDLERRRISLSRKSGQSQEIKSKEKVLAAGSANAKQPADKNPTDKRPTNKSPMEKLPIDKRQTAASGKKPSDDDGTMYNPFAEAFGSRREK